MFCLLVGNYCCGRFSKGIDSLSWTYYSAWTLCEKKSIKNLKIFLFEHMLALNNIHRKFFALYIIVLYIKGIKNGVPLLSYKIYERKKSGLLLEFFQTDQKFLTFQKNKNKTNNRNFKSPMMFHWPQWKSTFLIPANNNWCSYQQSHAPLVKYHNQEWWKEMAFEIQGIIHSYPCVKEISAQFHLYEMSKTLSEEVHSGGSILCLKLQMPFCFITLSFHTLQMGHAIAVCYVLYCWHQL